MGDRVIRTATHRIYERLVPGTPRAEPEAPGHAERGREAADKFNIPTVKVTGAADLGIAVGSGTDLENPGLRRLIKNLGAEQL